MQQTSSFISFFNKKRRSQTDRLSLSLQILSSYHENPRLSGVSGNLRVAESIVSTRLNSMFDSVLSLVCRDSKKKKKKNVRLMALKFAKSSVWIGLVTFIRPLVDL